MGGAEADNPILVEVWRGGLIESWHRGAVAAADGAGRVVLALGDVARPIYPRSAVKPFQAIPLVATGAAAAFGLTTPELAVACGSHAGEPVHVAAVRAMLGKAGLDERALRCGSHPPLDRNAAEALAASGARPTPLHNNCSGKHAAMLLASAHMNWPLEGYTGADHPVQKYIRSAIETLCGARLDGDRCAIDGCSAPTWAMPLAALATGYARFGRAHALPADLPVELAHACRALRSACRHFPLMVAGTGRLDARMIMSAPGDEAFVKAGAEGVYAGAVPRLGLGLAIKIDDGAQRAARQVLIRLLLKLLPDSHGALAGLDEPPLVNWRGVAVGELRPATALDAALAQL